MTKKLLILVILLLVCILLSTFSAPSPSTTNTHTSWSMYHHNEMHTATYSSGSAEKLGDVNADDNWMIGDVIYLINYLFKGGPPPKVYPADFPVLGSPPEDPDDPLTVLRHADANDDCKTTVSDVIYLINFLFKGGRAPIHNPPPLHAEQCCCVIYGNDSTKCDLTKCK